MNECVICKDLGIKYSYSKSEIVKHHQIGVQCCEHCNDSIHYETCGFCENAISGDKNTEFVFCKKKVAVRNMYDNCGSFKEAK